jgi:hypothetical protein
MSYGMKLIKMLIYIRKGLKCIMTRSSFTRT